MSGLLLITALAALLAWALGFPVAGLLRRHNIVDRPNSRSSHIVPTARGGGIALLLSCLLVTALLPAWTLHGATKTGWVVLAAVVLLAAVSFRDDVNPLPAWLRFACQVLLAAAVLAFLPPMPALALGGDHRLVLPPLVALGLGLLWITGYTNAFNFMDGINGLACTQAAVGALGTVLLALLHAPTDAPLPPAGLCCAVTGAALGFLPHNFPRARIFLGDVGSASLGFLLAVLVLWTAQNAGDVLLLPLLLLHANFILDTGITLVRRVARGERWYEPHREHFYQKLIRAGESHTRVTLRTLGLQLVAFGLLLFYPAASASGRAGLAMGVITLWLVYFGWVEFRGAGTKPRN